MKAKLFFAILMLLTATLINAQVSLTTSPYTQDFNTLALSGTSSVLPTGWLLAESGTNANTTYTAGTGSGTSGDAYSFGSAGNAERSLGGLQSGSLVPTIGAAFTNNSGSIINSISIAYTGEQWRLGATGRFDKLTFEYSIDATSLTTGTWVGVSALDFTCPNSTGTVGAFDGNLAGNRTSVSNSITGLSIPSGSTFYIRWNDVNATGSDDGTGIDDFALSFTVEVNSTPTVTGFSPSIACSGSGASVLISGTNFTGATNVSFNGTPAVFVVDNPGQITATLPAGATTGVITVTTPSGVAASSSNFTVNVFTAPAAVFTETNGNVATTTTIALHESANGFDSDAYTMTGTADLRNTTPSSGYTGASGNANIFFTNSGTATFQIADISTIGNQYISLSLGIFKSTIASNGSEMLIETSSDGSTYSPLSFSALPTGSGTATWYHITTTGTIPATPNLRIRFTNTSATTQFRIDDIVLTGYAPAAASITAGGPTTFCSLESVVLTSSSASSYLWSNGASSKSITAGTSGNYSCTHTDVNGCTSTSNVIVVTENPLPIVYALTGGGEYCSGGSGVPLGLNNSETGVSYQLIRNGLTNVGLPVSGTGFPISFGNQTIAGLYTVKATNDLTSCSAAMSGNAPVAIINFSSPALITGESMGSVAATTAVSVHETNNGFDNDAYAMTGTADVRNTSQSSGYAGATGNGNIFFTNSGSAFFHMEGINTSGYQVLTLSFGLFKSTSASNGNEMVVETSSDGSTYSPLTFSSLPTGSGTATWHYVTASGIIPATSNLRLRFTNTSSTTQFRIDDIKLIGENASTTLTANGPTTFCPSQSVVLTAPVASSYLWNTSSSLQSITVASTGNYSCTLTSPKGCVATSNVISVTVQDIILPEISCPGNIFVSNDAGVCGATVIYATPVGTDNCNSTTYQTSGYASGEFFPVGTTTNTFQVIDEVGNAAFCSFDVTVTDNESPTIICPGDVTTDADPGLCSASGFSIGIPFNDDNCGIFSMGSDAPESYNVGTTVVTWTVGDAEGNISTCAMNVTVNDNQAPIITNSPANFSSCNPVSWTPPTITDNCNYTYSSNYSPNDSFPSGTTTVIYTATDATGNSSTCNFNVTLLEPSVVPASITSNRPFNNICKQENITLTLNGGSLGYQAKWKWYSSSCGGAPVDSNVTSITVAPADTTTYYVRAEGYCNTTSCASIKVVVSNNPPSGHLTVISAPATGSVGDVDTVTVNTITGATFYRWNANGPVLFDGIHTSPYESASPSVTVTYTGLPSTGISGWTIHVFAANACGRTNTANTRIRSSTSAPGSLTGSTVACPDSTKIYTVSTIYGAASYKWTLNPGTAGTITGNGSQTVSVKFAAGFTQADLCVSGVTSFNLVGPSLCITIKNKTETPGALSGDTLPCPADTVTFGIANVQGAISYEWTIPYGASIVGNANGNSVEIKFPNSAFSGSVCVRTYSGCGYSDYSCLNVSPGSSPPVPVITGIDSGICGINGIEYSVISSGALLYTWTVPSDASIVSGEGTNTILVDFSNSFAGGNITVTASNGCGSNIASFAVTGVPEAPTISGPATGCEFSAEEYTASSSIGATGYNWYLSPLEGNIVPYINDPSKAMVEWYSNNGGTISVTATNDCGSSSTAYFVVDPCPARNANVTDDLIALNLHIYPNPSEGKFTLQYNSSLQADYRMQITDLSGRVLQAETLKGIEGMNLHEVDLNSIAKGIYLLKLQNNNNESVVIRLVVQ